MTFSPAGGIWRSADTLYNQKYPLLSLPKSTCKLSKALRHNVTEKTDGKLRACVSGAHSGWFVDSLSSQRYTVLSRFHSENGIKVLISLSDEDEIITIWMNYIFLIMVWKLVLSWLWKSVISLLLLSCL